MSHIISHTDPENFAKAKCLGDSLICRDKTIIFGDVTISSGCVIHPGARIIAKSGPIVIGNGNLVEERATILNNKFEPMIIGDHNVFEVDCLCEASKIGNNNILECKSMVGNNIELSDNCIIGAGCCLKSDDHDEMDIFACNTVVTNSSRRIVPDLAQGSQSSQLDFLRKFLANYQKLWRP